MLEDELIIVITSDKQSLCEELTCTTHRQQLVSVKNHNKQQNLDSDKCKNLVTTFLLMNTKQSTITKLKCKKQKQK